MRKYLYISGLLLVMAIGILWLIRPQLVTEQVIEAGPAVAVESAKASAAVDQPEPVNPATELKANSPAAQSVETTSHGVFGMNGPVKMSDIPAGQLRDQLAALSPAERARALKQLGDLHIPVNDIASVRVSSGGRLFYACDIPPDLSASGPTAVRKESAGQIGQAVLMDSGQPVPEAAASATVPVRHSRPGAAKVIFLDFDGATIAGTVWNTDYNSGAAFTVLAYSTDGDAGTFSDAEQSVINRVWERVAEDFRPFDVDVTTEAPVSPGANVTHVVITRNTRESGAYNPLGATAGGVAFLDNFGVSYDAAYAYAFVYHNNVLEETGLADAISHEAGHYIGGLGHDGTTHREYYGGHGTGPTSWGPIMGAPFGKRITQWSQGEYYLANNPQDDLASLAAHLGYLADDHSDSNGSPTPLVVSGNTFSGSGIINTTDEVDRFSITVGASNLLINVTPFPAVANSSYDLGANLDLMVQLVDSAGNIVASDSPYNGISPRLSLSVASGTYYLRIIPVGFGFPTSSIEPSGYTTYGSLGSYTINGTFTDSGPQLAPRFTTHPLNKILKVGYQSTFAVVASGTPDPSYQWQRMIVGTDGWVNLTDGGLFSGANTSGLTIVGAVLSMSGDQFRCIAANSEGTTISGMASVTITGGNDVIESHPKGAEIYPGGRVYFEMSFKGPGDVRWYRNGTLVKGDLNTFGPNAFYSINSASVTDAGSYYVTVTKQQVVYTSNTVELVVSSQAAPFIYTQPGSNNTSSNIGLSPTLTVDAKSVVPPTYQWRLNGVDIPGATGSSYTVNNITVQTAGAYDVVVTNPYGSKTSEQYTITLNSAAPVIYRQPIPTAVFPGTVATFSVEAVGYPPLTYRWQSLSGDGDEWTDLSEPSRYRGVNQPQLEVTTGLDLNASSYRCIVSMYSGVFTSSNAVLLTVGEFSPLFTYASSSQSVLVGQDAAFAVAVTGGTLSLQWQRMTPGGEWVDLSNDGIFSGVTTTTLVIAEATFELNGDMYRVVATNEVGTTYSDATDLTVVIPVPEITSHPTNQYIRLGDSINLQVEASSQDEISFQWQKNGDDIEGATADSYSISSAQASDVGSYTVIVSNRFGSVTSDPAEVVLAVGPIITTDPSSQTVYAGGPVTFSVTVNSNSPLSYQWYKQGVPIAGAIASAYTIAITQAGDAGDYTVVVTNIAGSDTSAVATLTVNPSTAPQITQHPSSLNRISGQPAVFSVTATGVPDPTYQWQVRPAGSGTWSNVSDGSTYAGSQTNDLTIASCQVTSNGDRFRCVVTNLIGSVTSNTATLTVVQAGFGKVSAGRYHSLRLGTSGEVLASGTNSSGQLGNGTTTNTTSPTTLTISGQTVTDIAAGAEHSLFLTASKQVWATGLNSNGQLADGTLVAKSTPILMATDAIAIAAANFHSVILKSDGTLWTVGGNDSGQLGTGNTTDTTSLSQVATHVVDIAAGIRQTLYLKSDGTLWGMGNLDGSEAFVSTPYEIASNVKTMAAGGYHSLFVKTDGTLWAMGYNPYGQLGNGTTTTTTVPIQIATGVRTVSAGYFHSVFIKTDNTLWTVGYNSFGQLGDGTTTSRSSPYQLTTNVSSVSASESYTLYTKLGGSLWAVGLNGNGQFGNGTVTTTPSPVQISTGLILNPAAPTGLTATSASPYDRVSLTWTPDGNATAYEVWRSTTNDSATATRIAANLRWAIHEDLTTSLSQTYYYWVKAVNPTGTSGFGSVASVTTGEVAVTPPAVSATSVTRQVLALGDGITLEVTANGGPPPTYQWYFNDRAISAATSSSYTLTDLNYNDRGAYWATVTNSAGTTRSAAMFVLVAPATTQVVPWGGVSTGTILPPVGLTDLVAIASGDSHGMGLKRDGTVVAWGDNSHGQISVPVGLTGVVAISAGGNHSAALKSDGTVVTWGSYYSGANAAVPTGLSEVTSLTTGGQGTLAVKSDGTVTGWNTSGPITNSLTDIAQTAMGGTYKLALGTDGIVQVWGGTPSGPSGPPSDLSGCIGIDAEGSNYTALKMDGSVLQWGLFYSGNAFAPAGLSQVTAVAAGPDHSLGLKADGTVIGWGGYNAFGQATVPTALTDVFAVAAGGTNSLALRDAGSDLAPSITANPVDQSVSIGEEITLSVIAEGTLVTYEWRNGGLSLWNNQNRTGVNAATLHITNAQLADSGGYTVTVRNSQGSVTSEIATVSVSKLAQTITFPSLSDRGYTSAPITLTATADSSLSVGFTVQSGPATVSGNQLTLTGTGTVTVRASQAGDANYLAATSVDRSFTVTANAASWNEAHFTEVELADPLISGPTADPDGDGLSNLLEYALGLNPKSTDSSGLPEMSTTSTDWVYTYTRPTDRADITYEVEASTSLDSWSTSGVTHGLVSTEGDTETWQATYPLSSATNVFFRLKIVQP